MNYDIRHFKPPSDWINVFVRMIANKRVSTSKGKASSGGITSETSDIRSSDRVSCRPFYPLLS